MKKYILLSLLVLSLPTLYSGITQPKKTNHTHEKIKQLKNLSNKETCTSIDLSNNTITQIQKSELKILRMFPNLTSLNLKNNKLTSIDPDLFENPGNLEEINVSNNPDLNIDITSLESVEGLDVNIKGTATDKWLNQKIKQHCSKKAIRTEVEKFFANEK